MSRWAREHPDTWRDLDPREYPWEASDLEARDYFTDAAQASVSSDRDNWPLLPKPLQILALVVIWAAVVAIWAAGLGQGSGDRTVPAGDPAGFICQAEGGCPPEFTPASLAGLTEYDLPGPQSEPRGSTDG